MGKFSRYALLCIILYSIFIGVGAEPMRANGGDTETKLIDIKANLVFSHKVNDTLTVLCLVGEFAAQHNGAVITADSAVKYDGEMLECFGNVLINKNTTYAYADRAKYDGDNNTASLFAPLIKVVDEEMTMYTNNFSMNTETNVGTYWGGGVTLKRNEAEEGEEPSEAETMESERGYYYADDKMVVGVESVEMRGEGYLLRGDSVIYEMESERAYFFEKTNIWNQDDSFIYGDKGLYDKGEQLYSVTENSYLLTSEQEMWCDSLEYYREREEAILRRNIQMDDTTNKSLAFGDFAHYWRKIEKIILTRRPAVINYDTQQSDSVFLRGDTILLLSYALGTGPAMDAGAQKDAATAAALAELMGHSHEEEKESHEGHNHEGHDHGEHEGDNHEDHNHEDQIEIEDEAQIAADTIPTPRQIKARERAAKAAERSAMIAAKIAARVSAEEAREYRRLEAQKEKFTLRYEERKAKGRNTFSDSLALERVTRELADLDSLRRVSNEPKAEADTLKHDLLNDYIVTDLPEERDSTYRVISAYRNAMSYRADFQMSCDSMVTISYDTTMTLHYAPVLWSDKNQVSSEVMYFYTKDGDLDYAEFIGKPVMSSEVFPGDSVFYNQVSGKEMVAYFENNNITRNDVKGNVETIYFLQDDNTSEVTTISKIESADASFFIKNQELDGVTYRTNPEYVFAPLNLMPADMSYYLEDFEWYGSRRPTRETIFDREIRPSIRERVEQIARPTFPILEIINKRREVLTKSGEWEDRTDKVSPAATLWMQQLGFTPGEPRKEGESIF